MCDKIEIHGDGWCMGRRFFIQCALFKRTGYADWTIVHDGRGDRDNRTDGETDAYYYAYRVAGSKTSPNRPGMQVLSLDLVPKFRVHANAYSYQSVFQGASESIENTTSHDLTPYEIFDERALPKVIEDNFL